MRNILGRHVEIGPNGAPVILHTGGSAAGVGVEMLVPRACKSVQQKRYAGKRGDHRALIMLPDDLSPKRVGAQGYTRPLGYAGHAG